MPHRSDDYEYFCHFPEHEGEYWFLYPLFEKLQKETGKYIDLYDDAVFGDETLDVLARTIAEARRLVALQPDRGEVVTGVQTHPVHKEMRAALYKSEIETLLEKIEEAIGKARATDGYVLFEGD